MKAIGWYGAFNNARVDIREMIDLYPQFDTFKFFLSSSGTQLPTHPIFAHTWDRANKRFLLDAPINPEFEDRLADYATAIMKEAGKNMFIVLFNRSHLKSRSGKFLFRRNPYRDNDIGVNWGADNTLPYLYNSITFGPGGSHTFHHTAWKDIDEKKLKFAFTTVGKIGGAITRYIQSVARVLVPIAKASPGSTLYIMGRNEEHAGGDGDRSELNVREKEIFEEAGVRIWGKKFVRVVNRDSDTFRPQLHPSITGPYAGSTIDSTGKRVVGCLGAKHEFHMKSMATYKQMFGAWKYDRNKSIASSDGWDSNITPYFKGFSDLWDVAMMENVDIDMLGEEALIADPGPVVDIMNNMRKAAPIYRRICR